MNFVAKRHMKFIAEKRKRKERRQQTSLEDFT